MRGSRTLQMWQLLVVLILTPVPAVGVTAPPEASPDGRESENGPVSEQQAADLLRLAHQGFAESETIRGYFAQALAYLDRASSLTATGLYHRGLCLEALGRTEEAAAALDASLKASPSDPYPMFALARLAWKAHDSVRTAKLLGEGLSHSLDTAGTTLLVEMFKDQKARGEKEQAMANCRAWLDRCGGRGPMAPVSQFMAEALEEGHHMEEALQCYGDALDGGDAFAASGAARMMRSIAGRGPAGLKQVDKIIPSLVAFNSAIPGCLLLAAADISAEAGNYDRSLRYLNAGYRGPERETFAGALRWLRDSAAGRAQASIVGRIDHILPESVATPRRAAAASSMLADSVFEALLRARQTGSGIQQALALAISASLEPVGPERFAAPSPAIDTAAISTGNSSWPQRYSLLEPYLKGDLKSTMKLLGGMVPGISVPPPVPPAPDRVTPPRTMPHRPPPPPETPVTEAPTTETPTPETPTAETPTTETPVEEQRRPPPPVATPVPIQRAIERTVRALGSSQTTERERLTCLIDVTRRLSSPIVIDLAGNGRLELSSATEPVGAVRFDIDGSGVPQLIQWTAGSSMGWLCSDIDGDGKISSGLELFGTAGGFANGYEKLGLLDVNHDGTISASELTGLSVWVDGNQNGRCDPGELTPVGRLGIESIALPRIGYQSTVMIRGRSHLCWDVWPTIFRVGR